MAYPTDCRFAESHEWHKFADGVVVIGLSSFAVDELTDLTFVQLPEVGEEFDAGDAVGEVESVKATSDIYTAIGGKVVAINDAAMDDPSIINNDPFGDGWMIKIEPTEPSELNKLMDAATYEEKYPTKD